MPTSPVFLSYDPSLVASVGNSVVIRYSECGYISSTLCIIETILISILVFNHL